MLKVNAHLVLAYNDDKFCSTSPSNLSIAAAEGVGSVVFGGGCHLTPVQHHMYIIKYKLQLQTSQIRTLVTQIS